VRRPSDSYICCWYYCHSHNPDLVVAAVVPAAVFTSWRCGYIAYPGQQLCQQFGGVQDLGAQLLKVGRWPVGTA